MLNDARLSAFGPHALAALRVITALLFIEHGTQKFLSCPTGFPMDMNALLWLAGALELFGGLLILVGLFTRPTAFVLSGFMAVAYFMAHAPRGFFPLVNDGELAVLYCFVFLYLFFAGPGAWSLDASRAGTRAGV